MVDKLKIILVCVYLYFGVTLSTSSSENKINHETDIVFKIQHPVGDEVLKIARADDDDDAAAGGPTTESSEPAANVDGNSTSLDQCELTPGCCYQYTWPGIPADTGTFNFTCEKFKAKNKDSGPCKNPVVFTIGGNSKNAPQSNHGHLTRPNLTELVTYCDKTGCKIYCAMTSSCIKYSYYDGDTLFNETRFCGSVKRGNSNLKKGCYQEKLDGYTREVCICRGDRCNGSPTLTVTNLFTLFTLPFFLICIPRLSFSALFPLIYA